ncbi:cell envelope biogenesis protein OmpA [Enterovibrio nigricans]|nr:OmpA family protein [Enterovibrio nigricans]PKF50039.1 cell envelope biogenesis protein OmpA [Enterovibrio nigricans]
MQVALPDAIDEETDQHFPCALFHLDPAEFEEGLYSIRVTFDPSKMDVIPDFVKKANIKEIEIDFLTGYQYELREMIRFAPHTPLGKIAIVSGDMISLEESLVYQFPQYLGKMQSYLTGDVDSKNISSGPLKSLTMLKGIRDATIQLGGGLLSGGIQHQMSQEGRMAVFNNISKLYWDSVKNEMPEPMKAAGELYYGVFSTKAAFDALTQLNDPSLDNYAKNLGWQALVRNKFIDTNKLDEQVQRFFVDTINRNYTALSGRVASSWFEGMSSFTGLGVNVVSTGSNVLKVYQGFKQVDDMQEKAKSANKTVGDVAFDYLDKIPVWDETRKEQGEAISKALAIVPKSGKADYIDNEKGSGIKIVFEFNSVSDELTGIKPAIEALEKALEKEKALRIEIEGHACQVDTPEVNLEVSKRRAENARDLFSESLHPRISIAAFGEFQPLYVPKNPEALNRSNEELKQNRRVEIRIYIPSLDIVFHPSRYGSQSMERARLALEKAMSDEDKAIKELSIAIFEGVVDVATYIPAVALPARGLLFLKEGATVSVSALKMLDSAFLDYHFSELQKRTDKVKEIRRLSRLHIELLKELRNTDVVLEKEVASYQELVAFLDKDETRKELLKRYQLRALAFNGLVLLLAWLGQKVTSRRSTNFSALVKEYKVQEYIDRYIARDDWSVATIAGNTMAENWINDVSMEQYRDLSSKSIYWPAPTPTLLGKPSNSPYQFKASGEVSGQFNRVFPVQTNLYDQDEDELFEEFSNNFNIQQYPITEQEIGFCRVLIQKAGAGKWFSYADWIKPNKSNRLGPYDRVKIQLVLREDYQTVVPVTLRYDRVDGLDIEGPAFSALLLPMKAEDFTNDIKGELAKYYERTVTNEEKTLTAIEFEPSYCFGKLKIKGLKPITSEGRLFWSERKYELALVGSARGGFVATEGMTPTFEKDKFARYQQFGGFRDMRYSFILKATESDKDLTLPIEYVHESTSKIAFRDLQNELIVGVHGENSQEITLDMGLGGKKTLLREKDVLVESFTLHSNEATMNTTPVIDEIKYQFAAIETESTGLVFFGGDSLINGPDVALWRKGFRWGKEGVGEKTSIYMLLVGQDFNQEMYETADLNWKSVDMSMQLAVNGGKGKQLGPTYFTSMKHVGAFSYLEKPKDKASKNSDNKDNATEKTWCIEEHINFVDAKKDNKKLADFVTKAISKISHKNDLSKTKVYTVYAMKFDLKYVAPTGRAVNGLRPFGKVIDEKFELSIGQLNQVDMKYTGGYDKKRDLVIDIPRLSDDAALADKYYADKPWVEDSVDVTANNIDKSCAEAWNKSDFNERMRWIKDWIEKQPTVVEAPNPLKATLDK